MSNESVISSNYLILCHPLLLLLSIFPTIGVFSSESTLSIRWPKYRSFSFSIIPSNVFRDGFKIDWFDLIAFQGTLMSLLQHHSSKASVLQHSEFFTVQFSHLCMTTGKAIALTCKNLRHHSATQEHQSQSAGSLIAASWETAQCSDGKCLAPGLVLLWFACFPHTAPPLFCPLEASLLEDPSCCLRRLQICPGPSPAASRSPPPPTSCFRCLVFTDSLFGWNPLCSIPIKSVREVLWSFSSYFHS